MSISNVPKSVKLFLFFSIALIIALIISACVEIPEGTTTTTTLAKECESDKDCMWCGTSCVKADPKLVCIQIAPPKGYKCKCVNGKCKAVKIESMEVKIKEILENPMLYEGKEVSLRGKFLGWSAKDCKNKLGKPPETRSDWILMQDNYCIYVTGKLPGLSYPKDVGKDIGVEGIVRVKDSIAYIEAKKVKILGGEGVCTTNDDCTTAGCSGEICTTKENAKNVVTACVYREWYDCLKYTSCVCIQGKCQWNETMEFVKCMEKFKGKIK